MFKGIDLQEVCNIIILVSAVIIAGKNIYGFFKKPVDSLHTHARAAEEKHIEQVIEAKMPGLLKQHGETVKKERQQEFADLITSVKDTILETLNDKVEELKEITLDQGQEIKHIQQSIDQLNESQMDVMRYDINRLYYKYRPFKKILDCDKKAFIKLYNDYHAMGGNTWIDMLYEEVINWEIVQDESELK